MTTKNCGPYHKWCFAPRSLCGNPCCTRFIRIEGKPRLVTQRIAGVWTIPTIPIQSAYDTKPLQWEVTHDH